MSSFKGITALTKSQYDNLATKDSDMLYVTTDEMATEVPEYSIADAGKVLGINSQGELGWRDAVWDYILPTSTNIATIDITWKEGCRINQTTGEETASTSCCISNEYIDLSTYNSNDFILYVSQNNKPIRELQYNLYGAFYDSNQVYTGALSIPFYSVYMKVWAFSPYKNYGNRAYLRLQIEKQYKPSKIYKITF